MRLNLLTQIGDAVKDRRTQASLAADLPRIAILRITPHRPDTKGRIRDVTEFHENATEIESTTICEEDAKCELRGIGDRGLGTKRTLNLIY